MQRLEYLYEKFIADSLGENEKRELVELIHFADADDLTELAGKYLNRDVPADLSHLQGHMDQLLDGINQRIHKGKTRELHIGNNRWRTRVACALIAATLLLALAYTKQATILNWFNPIEQVKITTAKGERQEVSLPDGTKVWLNAASSLTYPSRFDPDERKVLLSGEAFFDVTARASQPFSIRTDNLQVTVLGTRFNLKAYENESASSISMVSGKVNIDVNGRNELGGQVIAGGEQGVLNKSTGQFATTKIDTAWVGKWRSDELFIDGQSLKEVFGMLERQYNVSIDVHNKKILSESVTLNLQEPTLEEVLDMLSYTTNFKYEFKSDSTIKIR